MITTIFKQLFSLTFLAILTCSISYGRSPAVLDFVGIEPEGFNQNIIEGQPLGFDFTTPSNVAKSSSNSNQTSSLSSAASTMSSLTLMTLLAILIFPFASWFAISNVMNRKKIYRKMEEQAIFAKYKDAQNHALDNYDPEHNSIQEDVDDDDDQDSFKKVA
jgi:cell division protein FtsB